MLERETIPTSPQSVESTAVYIIDTLQVEFLGKYSKAHRSTSAACQSSSGIGRAMV